MHFTSPVPPRMSSIDHICKACQKIFPTATQLKEHNLRPYSCPTCEASFAVLGDLKTHGSSHAENKSSQSIQRENSSIKHNDKREQVSCLKCDLSFTSQQMLETHSLSHNNCEEIFDISNVKGKRKRIYKLTICMICHKSFANKDTLKIHQRIHTGEMPYSCSNCDKSFKSPGAIHVHLKTHTREKPYACSICGFSFAQSGQLKVHVQRRHNVDRKHKCNQCAMTFYKRTSRKSHMYRQHYNKDPSIVRIPYPNPRVPNDSADLK